MTAPACHECFLLTGRHGPGEGHSPRLTHKPELDMKVPFDPPFRYKIAASVASAAATIAIGMALLASGACSSDATGPAPVSYTHLRAHETGRNLVCRLLLEKKKQINTVL